MHPQVTWNWCRRAIARLLLGAYSLGVFLFGSIFQSPVPDELPAGTPRSRLPTHELGDALRKVEGFARLILRIGGPTFRVTGYLTGGPSPRFIPAAWWIERGAVEQDVPVRALGEGGRAGAGNA